MLSPLDRKIALMRRGVSMKAIAERLEVSLSHVSQVVGGKRRSARVEAAIAEALGRDVDGVFPLADVAVEQQAAVA